MEFNLETFLDYAVDAPWPTFLALILLIAVVDGGVSGFKTKQPGDKQARGRISHILGAKVRHMPARWLWTGSLIPLLVNRRDLESPDSFALLGVATTLIIGLWLLGVVQKLAKAATTRKSQEHIKEKFKLASFE